MHYCQRKSLLQDCVDKTDMQSRGSMKRKRSKEVHLRKKDSNLWVRSTRPLWEMWNAEIMKYLGRRALEEEQCNSYPRKRNPADPRDSAYEYMLARRGSRETFAKRLSTLQVVKNRPDLVVSHDYSY